MRIGFGFCVHPPPPRWPFRRRERSLVRLLSRPFLVHWRARRHRGHGAETDGFVTHSFSRTREYLIPSLHELGQALSEQVLAHLAHTFSIAQNAAVPPRSRASPFPPLMVSPSLVSKGCGAVHTRSHVWYVVHGLVGFFSKWRQSSEPTTNYHTNHDAVAAAALQQERRRRRRKRKTNKETKGWFGRSRSRSGSMRP